MWQQHAGYAVLYSHDLDALLWPAQDGTICLHLVPAQATHCCLWDFQDSCNPRLAICLTLGNSLHYQER